MRNVQPNYPAVDLAIISWWSGRAIFDASGSGRDGRGPGRTVLVHAIKITVPSCRKSERRKRIGGQQPRTS